MILPSKPLALNIRIGNASDVPMEKIPVKLMINGQQKAAAGADLPANDSYTLKVTLTPERSGWHYGLVQIEDYPVTFDDTYYFAFEVRYRIPVLVINEDNNENVLSQFYKSDSLFSLTMTTYRQVNYTSLSSYSLIILNSVPAISSGLISQLKTYVENGGNLLLIPSFNGNDDHDALLSAFGAGRSSGIDTTSTRVVSINESHPLFDEVIIKIPENANLPVVHQHLVYRYGLGSGVKALVTMLNGDDFLLTVQLQNGTLLLLAVPLSSNYSNFTTHPLFVPVMYGAALQGKPRQDLAFVTGKDIALETRQFVQKNSEQPFVLSKAAEDYSFIPEQLMLGGKFLINTHDGITSNGFYDLLFGDSVYHVFSYNYNRSESTLQFLSAQQIEDELLKTRLRNFSVPENELANPADIVKVLRKDKEIWKLFIIFALVMLLVEVLILRFWK